MNLLDPCTLGNLELPNRVLMAPMTRNRATDTLPTDLMATYYQQRAGAGLIITEATQVTPLGQGYPNTPGIHTQAQVDAWKRITDAVHEGRAGASFCSSGTWGASLTRRFTAATCPSRLLLFAPKGRPLQRAGRWSLLQRLEL